VPETIYVPVTQMSDGGIRQTHVWFETHWVVRTHAAGIGLAEPLARAMREVDPRQPFSRIQSMTTLIDRSLTAQRFHMWLIGASALLAVILASAGLFGVISFAVAQRRHEMGVRLALGATAGELVGAVVRQGTLLATIGIALGAAGAVALTRVLKMFVFGVSATDPATFIGAAAGLLALATLACLVPALSLTRVDPASILRRS
jgi:putative ABC transport system permease protein